MRDQPGFVSASIPRGLDGTQLVHHAQWVSKEAFQRMLHDPHARAHRQAASAMAKAAPTLYASPK